MRRRPTRNTAPKVQSAESAAHPHISYFSDEDWRYSGKYYALEVQTPSDIDPRRIRLRLYGRVLTVTLPGFDPQRRTLPENVNPKEGEAEWSMDTLWLRFPRTDVEPAAVSSPIIERDNVEGPVKTIPIDFDLPVTSIIRPRKPKTDESPMLDEAKSFIHDGERYFPLSLAAPAIQAARTTLVQWINKKTKFDGRPLRTYYFAPANRHFISEESISRATNRFIKWPSEEPAGPVALGEKRNQSGYIGLPDAAKTLGVDHHTIWRWITKGTAPTDRPLDVIKDSASDQLYIRQKDVSALKKLIPRGGLHAGRRSPPVLQPR